MTTTTTTWTPGWTNRRGLAARLLTAVRELPVEIERASTTQLHLPGGMDRVSTILHLHGAGHAGRGEDIAYSSETQAALPAHFARLGADLAGTWTIASLSKHLDGHEGIVPPAAGWDDKPGYHRWAVEAAALDLALRQRGVDLAALVQAPWQPVQVALSMGLGDPPSAEVIARWLEQQPDLRFKLDVSMAWSEQLLRDLAAHAGAIAAVDFKALYSGDWIDNDYPPAMYERVARDLPDALLEDARLDADSGDALDEHGLVRLTWDYPITEPGDVPGLAGSTASFSDLRPCAINIKPSRFGSIERLLQTIDTCDRERIPCYAGGQFELGIGRTQVQSIASICFPSAPNDCAPVAFHGASPDDQSLPFGPVVPPVGVAGFGWDAPTPALPR